MEAHHAHALKNHRTLQKSDGKAAELSRNASPNFEIPSDWRFTAIPATSVRFGRIGRNPQLDKATGGMNGLSSAEASG